MTQAERILAYDRIGANRRAGRILLAVFALASLPVAAYVALYLTEFGALFVGIAWVASGARETSLESSWPAFVAMTAIVAVALAGLLTALQYRFAARAILRVARARVVGPDEEPELHRQVENLCIAAGMPRPRLFVVESPAANAFSTGMTPDSASLVVTRGLLSLLERRELEGVLAHELSQIAGYDTRIGTLLAAGVAFMRMPFVILATVIRAPFKLHWVVGVGLLLYLGVPILASIPASIAFGLQMLEENTLEGIISLTAGAVTFYIFVMAPVLSHTIRVAVVRQRALLADADAVLMTRDAEGLARALAKMQAAGTSGLRVGGATAHLYVLDPLGEAVPWVGQAAAGPSAGGRAYRASERHGQRHYPIHSGASARGRTELPSVRNPVPAARRLRLRGGSSAPRRARAGSGSVKPRWIQVEREGNNRSQGGRCRLARG